MAQVVQGGCAIFMPVYKTQGFCTRSWVKRWRTWSDPSWTRCEQGLELELFWTPFELELFSGSVILHCFTRRRKNVGKDVHPYPRKGLWEKLAAPPCPHFAKKKKGCRISKKPHSSIYDVWYLWCEKYPYINRHSLVIFGRCLMTQNEWKL